MNVPFCKDCHWYRSGYRVDGGGCMHPSHGVSLVTGCRKEGDLEFERSGGTCGWEGVNFKAKPPVVTIPARKWWAHRWD